MAIEPATTGPSSFTEYRLPTLTFVVISSMVGSGILTTSGQVVARVGSHEVNLALWLLGGVVAICGALSLAELSAALPRSGGDYVYIYEAYGELPAFLAGWATLVHGFAGPIAATAWAASSYFTSAFGNAPDSKSVELTGLSTLFIVALGIWHARGSLATSRFQTVATLLMLSSLVTFVLVGLSVAAMKTQEPSTPLQAQAHGWGWSALLFSLVYINYSYSGWNGAAYLAGEVRDPGRRVPFAIVTGTLIVVGLYMAVNLVYACALPAATIRRMAEPDINAVSPIAAMSAHALLGARGGSLVAMGTTCVLLSALSAFILTGPRVAWAMACTGQFPKFAARLTRSRDTPDRASALLLAASLVLLWTGSFDDLLVFSSVGLALFSMVSISTVFWLRWIHPSWPRPFRTPGYPFVPAFYLLVTGALTIAAFQEDPIPSLWSLGSIMVGIPVYLVWRRLVGRPPS